MMLARIEGREDSKPNDFASGAVVVIVMATWGQSPETLIELNLGFWCPMAIANMVAS
jgi:hypothetical protein